MVNNSCKIYDLAIIGAGITGVGIAVAANQRGLKTILIDSNSRPAGCASDNSLRIIHGGFRYLQSLDFQRTIKSIKAQKELVEKFPQLVLPLRCLMPLDAWGLKSKYPAFIGACIYSYLQKFFKSPILSPKISSPESAQSLLPFLGERFCHSALTWYDAQMLSSSLLVNQELEQIRANVDLLTATKIIEVSRVGEIFQLIDSNNSEIQASHVINAAAYGANQIQLNNISLNSHQIYWGKSYNLVFKDERKLPHAFAVSSSEGRQYFVVPRADNIIAIGTFTAKVDQEITPELVDTDLEKFNSACPEFPFNINSLLHTEIGILPAKREFHGDKDFLNSDLIFLDCKYAQVFASKYTTYRLFGREVINKVFGRIR